ncbi:MAG: TlpA family protein disulfide reductase [Flammeovirgaceae bacterium]|nr:TlpA family protein disulfide reductase [Flammeovirgaceae bacterium]
MSRILNFLKPFAFAIAIVAVLKLTGTLSSVSYLANAALLKTGIKNANSEIKSSAPEKFDYDFKIKSLDGQLVDFKQFEGKTVFLNLWATWCGPCRAEMPSIQKLYDKVDKTKVEFVVLSLDAADATPKVVKYIEKNQYTFPVYHHTGYVPELLQVPSIPTTFIINKNGKVVSKEVGATNFDTDKFKNYLENL